MSRRAKRKVQLNKKLLLLILALVCAFWVMYVSFSKYVVKVEDYHAIESEEFYFTSDILVNSDEETKVYDLYDWDGTSTYTIPITLKNYDDSLKNTLSNIEYTIKIINGGNTTTYETGTLAGGEIANKTIDIIVTDIDAENSEFAIEVVSSSPYIKTLQATFKLYKEDNTEYKAHFIEETQDVVLNINSYADTEITITYDNTKYVLDNSQSIFDGKTIQTNGTTNSVTINVEKGKVYNITFIKVDSDIEFVEDTDFEFK